MYSDCLNIGNADNDVHKNQCLNSNASLLSCKYAIHPTS